MKLVQSLINYIKALQSKHKKALSQAHKKSITMDCSVKEVDASLYGFIGSIDQSNISEIKKQQTKYTAVKPTKSLARESSRTVVCQKQATKQMPVHTEIITVKLFEPNKLITKTDSKTPMKKKSLFAITEKLCALFLKALKQQTKQTKQTKP